MLERARRYTQKTIQTYRNIKDYIRTYERWLLPGILVAGLIVDFFTFRLLNINTALTLLSVHVGIATIGVAIMLLIDESSIEKRALPIRYARLIAPFLVQFSFGALLSATFIFYWFSGAIAVSWPFLLLLLALMTSNDVFREQYKKPSVQIPALFFVTFSFASIALPFVFASIDQWIFLLAGAFAIAWITLLLSMLSRAKSSVAPVLQKSIYAIVAIYIAFNAVYFSKILPPIPLAIRELDVYHSITRGGAVYTAQQEKESFIQRILPGNVQHIQTGDRLYVFSAIFAPENLNIPIYHRWQYKVDGKWVDRSHLAFTVSGGRQDGFRGYSQKSTLTPGKWRVRIETERGQVLGILRFTIKIGEYEVEEVSL